MRNDQSNGELHDRASVIHVCSRARFSRTLLFLACTVFLTTLSACGGTTSSGGTGPAGPGSVSVTVTPGSASVFLGAQQQFQATVTGSASQSVAWSVDGVAGGNASVGMVSSSGLYTGPAILPSPASVTVTATSAADPSASGSAAVTLEDNIAVSVTPSPADVPTGGGQVFTASVTGIGNFASGVTWSVNGVAGGNSAVGTIVQGQGNTALYTAPAVAPSPATVSMTATSDADSSKSGSASVTITCSATNTISPATVNLLLTQMESFTASLCVAPGGTITWDVNGVVGGNATLGTITNTGSTTATYSAPQDIPATNPVAIHATTGAAVASAQVTLVSNIGVAVTPTTATLSPGQRQTFAASVTNTADTSVAWTVNGIPDGSAAAGLICVTGSNPCVGISGFVAGSVDYIAPSAAPAMNPVIVTAMSHADPSKSGSAAVQIGASEGTIAVSVMPLYAVLAASGAQPSTAQFFATVTNTSNTAVTWSVQSAVLGQGCSGTACGSVNASGLFTAPTAFPNPNAISIIATSEADPTKSGSATIAIGSGPTILKILPSSVMAGAVEGFPLVTQGQNFVAGSAGAGSSILINGVARTTTCASQATCATSLSPQDVQSPGTLTLQVGNPGAPDALSNPVPFVIIPFSDTPEVVALSSAQSVEAGADLIVAEPTTAGASAPINVDSIGLLTSGNCTIGGSPVTVTRPASGTETVSLCINGNGLDPTFTYAFTSPASASGGDIGVTASAVTGLFAGTIELDLQISSGTAPGVRTLFITTLNNDRAAATGMLEVK